MSTTPQIRLSRKNPYGWTPEALKEIIAEKVEGIWIPKHDEKGHHYLHSETGTLVDSVTTQDIIDKPHLIPWAVEMGLNYYFDRQEFDSPDNRPRLIKEAKLAYRTTRDDAGAVGTSAHGVLDKYVTEWIKTGIRPDSVKYTDRPCLDARSIAGIRSGLQLFDRYNIIPIASEIIVGDVKAKSAGTLDLFCLFEGKPWIIDWKSSNRVSGNYALQVAAYCRFFYRMTGVHIKGCDIAHISKDYDKVTLYRVLNLSAAYTAFHNMSKVYQWRENGLPKLEERKNKLIIA